MKPNGLLFRPAVLLVAASILSCSGAGGSDIRRTTITIGVPPLEQNALLFFAEQRGFFRDNGLRVVIRDYPTGVASIAALRKGEVEIAESAEFPFVRAALRHRDLRIIACNDKFENDYLLAHKDRGITKVSDLKGKKVGLARGTITEFYLARFLALNRTKLSDVRMVDLDPSRFVQAFADGEVDAVIAWQPYVYRMQLLVRDAVVWKAQGGQPVFGVLVSGGKWLAKNREPVVRFLQSLHEAEDFLARNPKEAMEILRKRLEYEDPYIQSIWPRHMFSLSLDPSLLAAMEEEARWLAAAKTAGRKPIPDFADRIYTEGMRSVKPHAVSVIDRPAGGRVSPVPVRQGRPAWRGGAAS